MLEPRSLQTGWAKVQEVRQELVDFKKSGKPVYALLQSPGSREYYLATVADKIFLSPDDMLFVKGFRLEELYFKNTLDKLGITREKIKFRSGTMGFVSEADVLTDLHYLECTLRDLGRAPPPGAGVQAAAAVLAG